MKQDRIKLVRAMEEIARSIDDEHIQMIWLEYGIPDGEITETTQDDSLNYLVEDDAQFADLMALFIRIMHRVPINGGLYCDGLLSKEE